MPNCVCLRLVIGLLLTHLANSKKQIMQTNRGEKCEMERWKERDGETERWRELCACKERCEGQAAADGLSILLLSSFTGGPTCKVHAL